MRELQTAKEAKVNGLRCDNKMGRQDPEFTFLSGSLWNSGLFLTDLSWFFTIKTASVETNISVVSLDPYI